MKILFTGASSFTGMWFCEELAKAGHQVTAILRHSSYEGTRHVRVQRLKKTIEVLENISYNSAPFFQLITDRSFDLFCHHAADVTNYKSPHFDSIRALQNNVGDISAILDSLAEKGCSKILLTGSVFEQNEGMGSERAVSPYGLSKGLTADVFKYYCEVKKLHLGKFVIPNPFGPFEEFRFTSFLIKNWFEGKIVPVTHPEYVRDNIHISFLAKAYVHFAENLSSEKSFSKINPCGYQESQGAFTKRFAKEMQQRLHLPCAFNLLTQTDFTEPQTRLNRDTIAISSWNEQLAWDQLATYYQALYR